MDNLWSRISRSDWLVGPLVLLAGLLGLTLGANPVLGQGYTVCLSGCAYRSVQEAIDASSPGTTVRIGPGTYHESITLRRDIRVVGAGPNVTVLQGEGIGPVITASGHWIARNTVVEGLTVTGGGGQDGAGVLVRDGASPTLSDVTLVNNQAMGYGGGILVSGGGHPLLLTAQISANKARSGTGVALTSGGQITIRDSLIERNVTTGSGSGSALLAQSDTQVFLEHTAVENHTGVEGAGLRLGSGASANVIGGRFGNNQASLAGGAIHVASGASLALEGATLTGNISPAGGAISLVAGSLTVRSSLLQGNQADTVGGAIFADQASLLDIDITEIRDNRVQEGAGGGLFVANSSLQLTHSNLNGNQAHSAGGAIFMSGARGGLLWANAVVGNGAQDGAGIYLIASRETVRFASNTIAHNSAQSRGGGIVLNNGSAAVMRYNAILHNRAGVDGGGLIIQNSSTGRLEHNTIVSNQAALAGGGVLLHLSSDGMMRNNLIEGNRAMDGAGVQMESASAFLFENNVFVDNSAWRYGGALVAIGNSRPTIRANTFLANEGDEGGGAMFLNSGTEAILERNTISGNRTGGAGGALVINSAVGSKISHNTIAGNQAGFGGGGLHIVSSTANLRGNQILENTAGQAGGGIAIQSGSDVSMTNNLLATNRSGSCGDGMYMAQSTARIANNTFAENSPVHNGDGICLAANAAPFLTSNLFFGNGYGVRSIDGSQPSGLVRNAFYGNMGGDYEGISPGANDLLHDPRLVTGPLGNYYLMQRGAGQSENSPLIDAGEVDASSLGLDTLTTRTDGEPDRGRVDIGFHYQRPGQLHFLPLVQRTAG